LFHKKQTHKINVFWVTLIENGISTSLFKMQMVEKIYPISK